MTHFFKILIFILGFFILWCIELFIFVLWGVVIYPTLLIMKFCRTCNTNFPATREFFRSHHKTKDGLNSNCKPCHRLMNKRNYEANKTERLASGKRRRFDVRFEVLSYYSKGVPCCQCCKEKFIEFLCIDHINGNGSNHRRNEIKGRYPGIYEYLKAKNFPDGYQVLCHNCNMSKGFYGYCPHQQTRLD